MRFLTQFAGGFTIASRPLSVSSHSFFFLFGFSAKPPFPNSYRSCPILSGVSPIVPPILVTSVRYEVFNRICRFLYSRVDGDAGVRACHCTNNRYRGYVDGKPAGLFYHNNQARFLKRAQPLPGRLWVAALLTRQKFHGL